MTALKSAFATGAVLALLAILPVAASAQTGSGIAGIVKDTSGALLPGVTVEASSPALLERVRTTVTDQSGQYRIIDLRPGIYTVTFTLPGFSTVKREGLDLPANFIAPLNAELPVGSLEETVTVSGQSPVVDIQSTQRREVLSRQVLDALPTGRSYWAIGATLPAVSMGRFDVGGSTGMQMSGLSVYGSADQTMEIDGMSVNTSLVNGTNVGFYHNDDAYQEMTYEISGGAAETKAAGVRINMIPKQGGNEFRGHGIALFANTDLQSDNMTDELRARGLQTAGALQKMWDVNFSLGGPIKRDKLWFFSSIRNWAYNQYFANAFYRDGSQAVDDNLIEAYTNRLTYQINAANKVTAMYDKLPKWRGHRELEQGGVQPEAAVVQYQPLTYDSQAKWTSLITNTLLYEAGLSMNLFNYWLAYQPEVRRDTCHVAFVSCPAGTDYGDISKVDLILGTRRDAALRNFNDNFDKKNIVTSLSYVTGSHSLKGGVQWGWGAIRSLREVNGDIIQRYRNGVPDSVIVRNSPTFAVSKVTADLGLYVQDSWTLRRLTLNPGLRFDYFRGEVPEQTAGPGRFVPARRFDPIPNLPNWKTVSPRLGAAYDLFGDTKTAIKASAGKYVANEATGFPARYNPMVESDDTRTWNDLNRDNIAQENELGPSTNTTFGVRRNRTPSPDLDRTYNWFYSAGIQHEVIRGMSVSFNYYRRQFSNLVWLDNLATTHDDYALITIPDPRGNGATLPVYNLNRAKLGLVDELDDNSSRNKRTFNGFDVMVTARLPNGATLLGGTSTGRTLNVTCDIDDPNGTATSLGAATASPSLRFCDQSQFDVPWLTNFKASGIYPLPYGLRLSGVFASVREEEIVVNYIVNRTIVPTLTQPQVSVRLNEPGSLYLDRVNMLSLALAKSFSVRGLKIAPQVDLFNVLNASTVVQQLSTVGPAFGTPQRILEGRLVRLGVQVDF